MKYFRIDIQRLLICLVVFLHIQDVFANPTPTPTPHCVCTVALPTGAVDPCKSCTNFAQCPDKKCPNIEGNSQAECWWNPIATPVPLIACGQPACPPRWQIMPGNACQGVVSNPSTNCQLNFFVCVKSSCLDFIPPAPPPTLSKVDRANALTQMIVNSSLLSVDVTGSGTTTGCYKILRCKKPSN